jgi:hypothetical protein
MWPLDDGELIAGECAQPNFIRAITADPPIFATNTCVELINVKLLFL